MYSDDENYSVPLAILVIRHWQAKNDERFLDRDYSPWLEAVKIFKEAVWNDVRTALISPDGQKFSIGADFWLRFTSDGRNHELFSLVTGLTRPISDVDLIVASRGGDRWRNIASLLRDAAIKTLAIMSMVYFATLAAAFLGFTISLLFGSGTSNSLEGFKLTKLSAIFMAVMAGSAYLALRFMMPSFAVRNAFSGFPQGWSVVVSASDLADYLATNLAEAKAEPEIHSTVAEEKRVTDRILKVTAERPTLTRTEVCELVGSSVTKRGFGRAWDNAREINPSLGKPGRKPG